ncbi:MAG: hypothetical protein JSU68_14065 [Phycisphaerales bacterium]|nr:MAG: hypothetical protein JSU68_14065 [Phycisphaerales bacterium]
MKALFILIILVVIAGAAVYSFGGYSSYDPTQKGREAKAAISPGMTLEQVVDAIDQPTKYAELVRIEKRGQEYIDETGLMGFTLENVRYRIDSNEVPEGFYLLYHYSAQASFEVHFDGKGIVTHVKDHATMADLLQTRE